GHAVVHCGADLDPTALRCEFEGIGEQVQEDLLDLAFVAADHAHAIVDGVPQRDPTSIRPLTHEGQGVVDRGWQVEVRHLQLHPSRFDFGEIENVVDQGQQV